MQKWSKNKKAGQRTRTNGKAAREKIINSNLRLVVKMSKEFMGLGLPLLDLISEGNIGLMRACDKYELDKGAKFSTYASFWIRQGIFRALDNKARLIRVPTDANRKYPKIIRYINEQEELTGEKPTTKEIAKEFKTAERRIISIMEARKVMTSMDAKVSENSDDGGEVTWAEFIPDHYNDAPDTKAEITNNKKVLNKLLNKLTRREKSIIIKRWGINDKDFHTLEKIGDNVGVTRERIRQIEEKAIRKLRTLVRDEFHVSLDAKESTFMFKF
jgi:RNA polymerase primary sigma factor